MLSMPAIDVTRPGTFCVLDQTFAELACTSATAQAGPITAREPFWYVYVCETVFAAAAIPASMLPLLTVNAAFARPAASWARICLKSPPGVGRIELSFHVTLSCDAAWIASYSRGATTPRKSPWRTTRAPGRFLIELSSTEMIGAPVPNGPCPRGRTTRPWSMPGTRMLCTYVYVPAIFAGRSTRGTRVPTTL